MVRNDVVLKHFLELLVGNAFHRPVIRVGGCIADDHVNLAECLVRGVDHGLQLVLGRDVRGHGNRGAVAMLVIDAGRHFLARARLARRDGHLGALIGHGLGNRPANAARRSCNDG